MMNVQNNKTQGRIVELDILRGIAIVLMIFGHSDIVFNTFAYGAEGLGGTYTAVNDLYSYVVRIVRLPFTAMFFAISGIVIGANAYRVKQYDSRPINLLGKVPLLLGLQLVVVSLLWSSIFPAQGLHIYLGVLFAFAGVFFVLHFLRKYNYIALFILGTCMLVAREFFPVDYVSSGWVLVDIL